MKFYSTTGRGPGFRDIGLDHNPFNALVVPRPIGWISTVGATGLANLAPYSFFNAVSGRPPMVMFSSSERSPSDPTAKDTLRNIRETKQFVVNLATAAQQTEMNESSAAAPPDVDEFEAVGLEKLPSHFVAPPRVKGAPVHLECELDRFVDLTDGGQRPGTVLTIGLVVGVHIDDAVIVDGKVDIARVKPIARLGYFEYCVVDETFDIMRPTWPLSG
jgi:flavin reductase (DIM6/NTAB) family NADH-FMN oxidoreductase RutF